MTGSNEKRTLNRSWPAVKTRPFPGWIKTLVFLSEIILVSGLLIWWLSSKTIRESRSLWVLFLYAFPAEFLIALVPHEPVLLYFAKFYSPLTVALISVAGTVLTEILNYTVFKHMADFKVFQRMLEIKIVRKTVNLFNKAPFLALCVAGFTPIPFYPFRFLVVVAHYPITRYLLAVLVSRTPRMVIIALAAKAIQFSDTVILIITVVLIGAANVPLIRKLLPNKKQPISPGKGVF